MKHTPASWSSRGYTRFGQLLGSSLRQFEFTGPALELEDEEPSWDRPALFAAYPQSPTPRDYVARLRAEIRTLHEQNAVDEGTPDITDGHMDATSRLWRNDVDLEYAERAWLVDRDESELEARKATRERAIQLIDHELADIDRLQHQNRAVEPARRPRWWRRTTEEPSGSAT